MDALARPKTNLMTPVPRRDPAVSLRAKEQDPIGPMADNGLSFGDLIDIFDPLQHIPLVNTIYRAITGDQISAPARLAGGSLYGGVIGLVASLVDTAVEGATGKDTGKNLIAMLEGDRGGGKSPAKIPALAQAPAEAPALVASTPTDATGDETSAHGPDYDWAAGNKPAADVAEIAAGDNDDDDMAAAPVDPGAVRQAANATQPMPPTANPNLTRAQLFTRPAAMNRAAANGLATPTPVQPLNTQMSLAGVRGAPGVLPSPQQLAANPQLLSRLQRGTPAAAGPRGPLSPTLWRQLMQAAQGGKPGAPVTVNGSGGLASGELAKAVNGYGGDASGYAGMISAMNIGQSRR